MIKVTIKDTETNETTKYDCKGTIFAINSENDAKVGIIGNFSIYDFDLLGGQIASAIEQAMKGDGVIE